ncbi:MAG: methyltransferase domain-containing protein [Armatimonadota bacterium]
MLARRNRPEAMDAPDLDPHLLADDLANLETLNRLFGGRNVVRRALDRLLPEHPPGEPLSALDLGSGAGDLCRVLVDECRRRGQAVTVWSLDFHPQIQAYAREQVRRDYPEIRFLRADARQVPLRAESVDLALCTLALHHFTEEDAVAVLREMQRVTRRWALVSDLCRSAPAYAGVWLATRFMRNPMTRHDGPVSVRRAFSPAELQTLASSAGWENAELRKEPWFRMSLLYRKPRPW